MPVGTASDMGVLALSLVRHLLDPIKAKAAKNPEQAQNDLAALFAALSVPDAKELTATVKDLKSLTAGFRQMLEAKRGRNGLKLNSQYFGASVSAFQSGYDGHWITRDGLCGLERGLARLCVRPQQHLRALCRAGTAANLRRSRCRRLKTAVGANEDNPCPLRARHGGGDR